jgi:uncharacterized cupredoxin-like copper-binding protein
MKKYLIATAFAAVATATLASGNHQGGHAQSLAGEPGREADVTRTIEVTMEETDDGKMLYRPAAIEVKAGQTVRLAVRNAGETEHEFVLDTHDEIMAHKMAMEESPAMRHDEPNSVRLAPGQSGNIVWRFTAAGTLTFACLIPGHFEAGMRGDVTVVAN